MPIGALFSADVWRINTRTSSSSSSPSLKTPAVDGIISMSHPVPEPGGNAEFQHQGCDVAVLHAPAAIFTTGVSDIQLDDSENQGQEL